MNNTYNNKNYNSGYDRPSYSTTKKKTVSSASKSTKTSSTRMARAKKRRNAMIRLIAVVLLVIIGITIGIIALVSNRTPDCYQLTQSSITMYYSSRAVILKDEAGYSYPSGSTVVSRVADGTYVQAGDEIAVVRTEGFNDDWYAQLEIARRNTIDYLMRSINDTEGTLASAIDVLDLRIEELTAQMIREAAYNPSSYKEYSGKITKLNAEKKTLALDLLGSDPQISDYLNKETIIEEKIESCTQHIIALRSGIISYNSDGYANLYNYDDMESFTHGNLDKILANESTLSISRTRMASDYYISDMSRCYLSIYGTGNDFQYLNVNDEAIIRINQIPQTATIKKVEQTEGGAFLVFEPMGDFTNLYRDRVLDITIQKTWNGLVLPKEHIVKKKDQVGVYVYDEEEKKKTFVPISVAAENDTVVILDTSSIDNVFTKGVLIVKQK